MKEILKVLLGLASNCLLVGSLHAGPITTVWETNDLTQFDYPSRTNVTPTVPTSFDLTIEFPSVVSRSVDHGTTSITYFGGLGDTIFDSPLTPFVGADPYGAGLLGQSAYTFPNVSDYENTFFEEFGAQSNSHSRSGDVFWNYHIELRARRYTSPSSGDGSSDYFFTESLLKDFLKDIQLKPEDYQIIFNESWQIYDASSSVYLDGQSWSAYNATLKNVTTVPVPSVVQLMLLGLLLLKFRKAG
ncbi:MAG: hypothetical protein CL693_04225 [Cellvibrionaceae bacterium]|nr:hypothetical protein [Cellvibrionaceae bacterium]|tara:strand:- start:462 stop:1193 length:732 start_codon:yes stop_codon:yes gene_type:complete